MRRLGDLVAGLVPALQAHAGGFVWSIRIPSQKPGSVFVDLFLESREPGRVRGTWRFEIRDLDWFDMDANPRILASFVARAIHTARRELKATVRDQPTPPLPVSMPLVDAARGES